jgi:hypothetical protein
LDGGDSIFVSSFGSQTTNVLEVPVVVNPHEWVDVTFTEYPELEKVKFTVDSTKSREEQAAL